MAQKEEDLDLDVAAAGAAKGGNLGRILLYVAVVLLAVGFSVTTTLLLLGDDAAATAEADAGGAESDAKSANKALRTPLYLNLDPAFVVNLNDDSGVRFLQVSVAMVTYSSEALETIKTHTPLLRHHLVLLFSNQKFADLKTKEGKIALQQEALATVRDALTEAAGAPLVEELYLPSLVGQ